MVTLLFEKTVPLALLGLLLTFMAGAVWWHTRHRIALGITLAVLLLAGAALLVNRLVETERESATRTIYEICEAIGVKSIDELLEYVHPSAEAIREQARREVARYELQSAQVTQIWDVQVDEQKSPLEATVWCNVAVTGGAPALGISNQRVVRYVIVRLAQDQGRWKVIEYQHDDPQRALQRSTTSSGPGASQGRP